MMRSRVMIVVTRRLRGMYSSGFNNFVINYMPAFSAFCVFLAIALAVGHIFFWTPIKASMIKRKKKEWHEKTKNRLLEKYKNDSRFIGGTIYECATGYFMTIAESGYIEFNTPSITDYVCHIKDINGVELVKDRYSNAPDIGAAGIGKMLYGDVGAVIGGLGYSRKKIGRISIMFKVNDFKRSLIEMKFIDGSVDTNSYDYELTINQTQRLFSQLDVLDRKYREERGLESEALQKQHSS